MLTWAFYEMSGGVDFEPLERKIPVAKAPVEELTVDPIMTVTKLAEVAATPEPEKPPMGYTIIPAPKVDPEAEIEQVAFVTEVTPAPDAMPVRKVAGDWVNMRDGPSTTYLVLDTLPRGTQAEVLAVNADGWAQIRLLETGQVGWMAERLLSEG
jgi:uncharacterized protein YgiM (DUF1202 family)